MRPQTIQIFLPDGSPQGIKIAEITNRVVTGIFILRKQLDNATKHPEISNVAVYFLLIFSVLLQRCGLDIGR